MFRSSAIRFTLLIIILLQNILVFSQTYVPGEYILKWRSHAAANQYQITASRTEGYEIYQTKTIFHQDVYWQHVKISPDLSESFEKSWKKNPDILHFQKNKYLKERRIPDDPQFPQQWQYINNGVGGLADADLDMDEAWEITTGGLTASGDTIVVCVIDEGVNLDHPDLKDNLWKNHHEIPGNGIDDDGNGYVDDVAGWNVTSDNDDLSQGGSHGTPVCGIVGAKGNNGLGVSGINWNVKVMFVKYGSATEANALASYAYAYTMRKLYNDTQGEKGAFIVVTNASWGVDDMFPEDAPLWCEMYDLLGEVGILSCGATTNRDINVDIAGDLPTTCESEFLLSVTNLNRFDQKLSGAGYGYRSIDLGAYGHQTFTLSRSAYAAFGGTSGATPHVAGTIALMYAIPCTALSDLAKSNPASAALVAKDMLMYGNVPNVTLANITSSGGRLNTYNALNELSNLCQPCARPAGISLEASVGKIKISWENANTPANVAVRYRKSDKPDWEVVYNISNGHEITGLDVCTEYEIQMGSSCSSENPEFGYARFFTSGGCCPVPSQFTSVTENGNVILSWEIGQLENVEFALQIEDKFGNSFITQRDTNQWILENPDSCSWFKIGVQAICPQFGTVSPLAENIIVNTACGACNSLEYCTLNRKNTSDEWIQQFRFGSVFVESGVDPDGYGNYLGKETGHFTPDSTYEIEIVPGFSSSPFVEDYSVYADYNQDGFFSAEELIFSDRTSSESGVSGMIKIPGDANEGMTRLRVIMAFQSHNSPCDAEDFEYGEWEEYCIKISRETPDCYFLEDIVLDSASSEGIKVHFPVFLGANQYIVLLKKTNETDFDTFYVETSPLLLNALDSCTTYEILMAPDCGFDPLQYSEMITFLSPCKSSIQSWEDAGLTISPNPFIDIITIKTNKNFDVRNIELFDLTGQKMKPLIIQNQKDFQINIPDLLPSGMYILKVESDAKTFVRKMVKM